MISVDCFATVYGYQSQPELNMIFKENIKALYYWPFVREIPKWLVDSFHSLMDNLIIGVLNAIEMVRANENYMKR